MDNQNVVIIGAGPAGITTAIQLKRYDIKSIILEQDEVGGLLREANLVENYPGFPEGIWGPNLVSLFRRQLKDVGVSATFEKVLEMEYTGEVFLVKTNRRTLTSTFAVIATGTKSRKFSDLPIAPDVRDRIFYGVNPIRTVVGKKVAIIGAGDAAFDYALNFSRNNEVLILCRSEQTRCIPILREKCMKHKHISLCSEVSMKSIGGGRDRVVMVCTGNGSN